jgi:hypothetical protein
MSSLVVSNVPSGGSRAINTKSGFIFEWKALGEPRPLAIAHVPKEVSELAPPRLTLTQQQVDEAPTECYDRFHSYCARMAKRGNCPTAPGWMAVHCPRSCDTCALLDPSKRCALDRFNLTAAIGDGAGTLDALFEQLIGAFPADAVSVLSGPGSAIPEGPWVVTIDDFVREACPY